MYSWSSETGVLCEKLISLVPLIKCALSESIPRPTQFIKNTDQALQILTL